MKAILLIAAIAWSGLWFTPDQQGHRLFKRGEFAEAATTFRDPLWQGMAWYRAAEFDKSAQAFGRSNTVEAAFNQGNAWLMRGKYDTAIGSYDRALAKRPEWKNSPTRCSTSLGLASWSESPALPASWSKLHWPN